MQLYHRVHGHSCKHFIEVAAVVVDDSPAAAPSWQAVDLRDGACANDWHGARRVAKGVEGALRIV